MFHSSDETAGHVPVCFWALEALPLLEVTQKHHPAMQLCVGLAGTPNSGTLACVRSHLVLWPACIPPMFPTGILPCSGYLGTAGAASDIWEIKG